jgi:hypothetical protein
VQVQNRFKKERSPSSLVPVLQSLVSLPETGGSFFIEVITHECFDRFRKTYADTRYINNKGLADNFHRPVLFSQYNLWGNAKCGEPVQIMDSLRIAHRTFIWARMTRPRTYQHDRARTGSAGCRHKPGASLRLLAHAGGLQWCPEGCTIVRDRYPCVERIGAARTDARVPRPDRRGRSRRKAPARQAESERAPTSVRSR